MRVVVLQPGYLPWLGFFDLLQRADRFVIYDDVQFDRRGWRQRNRIKTAQGVRWLSVPVNASRPDRIYDVTVASDQNWARQHLQTIRHSYHEAPFFDWLFDPLAEVLERPWHQLLDLDVAVIRLLASLLRIDTPLLSSRELAAHHPETASQGSGAIHATSRLVAICRALDADRYLTGDSARDYLQLPLFEGIEVEWHGYHHPEYSQLHGPFIPYLSVIDLMFNHGPESLGILSPAPGAAH